MIDVGSNTARLLVATVTHDGLVTPVAEERDYLRLGAEIEETGTLGPKKIAACTKTCKAYARRATELGAVQTTVIVTAPGRQGGSATRLVDALTAATASPVRVLSGESEGRLAFHGAVARAGADLPDVIAVVDLGGGSTEIAVGSPHLGSPWARSADLGSLRLTRAHLHDDPPGRKQVEAARDAVRRSLAELDPPRSGFGIAVGGSARALGKIVGPVLDADALDHAAAFLARRPAAKAVTRFGISPQRAETLLAGAIILAETCRMLDTPLELGRGGLREGAALELAALASAHAA